MIADLKNELLVLKFGTTSVCDINTLEVREEWIQSVADDVKRLMEHGNRAVIFTSGGLATGRKTLADIGVANGKVSEDKRIVGAMGLSQLLYTWQKNFSDIALPAAALSIREADVEGTTICEVIMQMVDQGIVPIINENIPLQTDFNNDELAAKVCKCIGASKFILFTDTNGVFTDNPKTNPDAQQLQVLDIGEMNLQLTQNETGLGTGGMKEKLRSAIKVKNLGVDTIIANGTKQYPLSNLANRNSYTVLKKLKQ